MKTLTDRFVITWQRGYVSVIAVLVLSMAVLVILAQSVRLTGTKALESQQYLDSVMALGLAESGTQIALSKIVKNFNSSGDASGSCSNSILTLNNEYSMGGTDSGYTYLLATYVTPLSSNPPYCAIRVKGRVRTANRTIETRVQLGKKNGNSGYVISPNLNLSNNYDVPALAIFDLAWRTSDSAGTSSTGQNSPKPSSGNVICSDCLSTAPLWYDALTGANSLGGTGNYFSTPIGYNAPYTHILGNNNNPSNPDPRNWTMVGLMIGGTTNAPLPAGGYIFENTSNSPSGDTTAATNMAPVTGCTDDNTNAVVFGFSGGGSGTINTSTTPPTADTRAGLSAVALLDPNKSIPNNIIINLVQKTYYPPHSATSPVLNSESPMGDVFSEIWFYYKAPVFLTVSANANKNDSSISVTSAATSYAIPYIKATQLSNNKISTNDLTYITSISGNTLNLSNRLIDNLKIGDKICIGLCGAIAQNRTNAILSVTRNSQALAKAWIAGITCLKGVNSDTVTYVQPVASLTNQFIQWHEVISGE